MIHETGYWNRQFAEKHHIHSPNLSNFIINFLSQEKETFIYDLGCGLGDYLKDLKNSGYTKLLGVEVDPLIKHDDIQVRKFNLTESLVLNEKGNIISLEVGEHIPSNFQEIYLDNITKNCKKYLIISWAIRGQGGYGHVNELNNEEILPMIINRGFKLLEEETKKARLCVEPFCRYFSNTIFIFEKI